MAKTSAESKTAETANHKAEHQRRPRRRAEETRGDILNAAETLFRKRGFAAVSIADIANELAMSPANIFKHFHSKNALVDAIASRQIGELERQLDDIRDQGTPFARLLNMTQMLMQSHLRDLTDNPYIFEMILLVSKQELQCGQHYRTLIIKRIAEIIKHGVSQDIYMCSDPCHTAETVAHALAGVLHPVIIATEDPVHLTKRCEDLVRLIDAALQNPLAK